MFHGNCENCGREILHEKALKLGGTYWITTSGSWFCSNRCKDQYVARNSNNNQVVIENTSIGVNTLAEQNRKQELDLEAQRMREEKEREEGLQRMLKGQKLKDKGRPFAAWLTELDPVYSSCIVLGIFVSFTMKGLYMIIGSIALVLIVFLLIREAVKKA